MLGYHSEVILAGRRINDGMAKYGAQQTVKQMIQSGSHIKGADVNVLGLTFKENCSDIRNSKVVDLIRELESFGLKVHVHDPVAVVEEARHEYGLELQSWQDLPRADALVVAVAHTEFVQRPLHSYSEKLTMGGCFIDVKSQFDRNLIEKQGYKVWRL